MKAAMLLAVAGVCSAAPIKLPYMPDLEDVVKINQVVKGLNGLRVTSHFAAPNADIACFWRGLLQNACADWFVVKMTVNQPNWNQFEITNTSQYALTSIDFDPLTFLGIIRGKRRMFGHFAIDLPGTIDTFGSGAGHSIDGHSILSYVLRNRLSEDLYGGVTFQVNLAPGQTIRFRLDIDELVSAAGPPVN
jgi:hypothetical protein